MKRGRKPAKTEILGIECGVGSVSPGEIHDLFYEWWKVFELRGRGLLVGYRGQVPKKQLKPLYPAITEMRTVDLGGSNTDLVRDLTLPNNFLEQFDWVFNQATVEHVVDPVAVLRNCRHALFPGGLMFVHSHGPAFRYHPAPIDCYRFLPDIFTAWATHLDLTLEDSLWTEAHIFAVYRKPDGS